MNVPQKGKGKNLHEDLKCDLWLSFSGMKKQSEIVQIFARISWRRLKVYKKGKSSLMEPLEKYGERSNDCSGKGMPVNYKNVVRHAAV